MIATTGIITLGRNSYSNSQLPLSTQNYIYQYLVIDWGGKCSRLRQIPLATGVLVGLRVPIPQSALLSVLLEVPSEAPEDYLSRSMSPA